LHDGNIMKTKSDNRRQWALRARLAPWLAGTCASIALHGLGAVREPDPFLVPLAAQDSLGERHSRCSAVISGASGERLAVSDGTMMLVRLNRVFMKDDAGNPPPSPLVAVWLSSQSGRFGRYRSRGSTQGGFRSPREGLDLVFDLKVSGRTDCPTAAGGLCEIYTGRLDFGHTPQSSVTPSKLDGDDSLFFVAHPDSSLPVTVREQCEAPYGQRFYDGLVLHRKLWETLIGAVLVFFGLTH
jgi:hypothetical protein